MIKKEGILLSFIIIILLFSLVVIFNPKDFSLNISAYSIKELSEEDIVEVNNTQFFKDMRFSRKILGYRIDSSCNDFKKNRMERAFDILKNETLIINFVEVDTNEDIYINCKGYSENISDGYIKAGEGGAYSVVNTGKFNVIKKGKISFYNSSDKCDKPITEIHELLHVFGFKHSEENTSIMYNVSLCEQNITKDIIKKFIILYTTQEIPDLGFENLSHKRGLSYTDFSVDVINRGLREAKNVSIEIDYGNSNLKIVSLGDFGIGDKKKISADNFRVNRNRNITLNIETINDLNETDNTLSF